MARQKRLCMRGCAQHVIQRGNNREACFYDEADYKAYLAFLKDAANKYEVSNNFKRSRYIDLIPLISNM